MLHAERKTATAAVNTRKRRASRFFASTRPLARVPANAELKADLHRTLLHGVAAQEAFVALFDAVDDFDSMAYEAAVAPLPPED